MAGDPQRGRRARVACLGAETPGNHASPGALAPRLDRKPCGRFAAALVQSLQLGKHDGTDVLAISFSSPDLVGHGFGPRSREVQDMYAHLDKTIGTLFDQLDTLVGKDQWVAGLSADHGVTPIPEQLVAEGKNAVMPEARARSALVHVLLNHNDFVSIR